MLSKVPTKAAFTRQKPRWECIGSLGREAFGLSTLRRVSRPSAAFNFAPVA